MKVQLRRLGPISKIKVLKKDKDCLSKVWICGRGTSCQIYTNSKYASRRHFSIIYKNRQYFITDLNSANGTFLNDEKVTGERLLTLGSIISVGVPPDMFNSPDCIVYKFEPTGISIEENIPVIPRNVIETEKKNFRNDINDIPSNRNSESVKSIEAVDEQLKVKGRSVISGLEDALANCLKSKKTLKVQVPGKELGYEIHLIVEKKECSEQSNAIANVSECESVSNSGAGDVTINAETKKRSHSLEGPTPVKVQRLEMSNSKEEPETVTIDDEENLTDEDDLEVYEAPTQVDEVQVEERSDSLNYSQTEELIEVDDSEEVDWMSSSKPEETKPELDEDDDVIFLQTIVNPLRETSLPSNFKLEDDFTDIDKKWLEKLLKVKQDREILENLNNTSQAHEGSAADNVITLEEVDIAPVVGNEPEQKLSVEETIPPLTEVTKAPVLGDLRTAPLPVLTEKTSRGKKDVKKVRFNLEPEIRYFEEEISKSKWAATSAREKQQFLRVIYNFCNWNAHWLEECNKIPSEVHPPGLSDHPCKRIRNNFLNHSHYMSTFVPNLTLQVWEKVKEKCSDSQKFFKQTISLDSCVNYPKEKLTLCRCTGLVKSMLGHKNLLREGHLVVLSVHQAPQSSNKPNKYSKKVGYLIFGFVEKKTYEDFADQNIHPKLAEKTESIPGEFHLVKLEILVKLRPNLKIDKEKLMQVTVICQISPALRRFRAICYLPLSPLCETLVKLPKFQLPGLPLMKTVFKGQLSRAQEEIILRLTQGCMTLNSFLYSIQGAAGTGKSHVVIALIWQLLFSPGWSGERPKIIYCAQDGAPLDDMIIRLKNSFSEQGSSLNLVRASYSNPTKPEIKDLCLFTQCRKLAKRNLAAYQFEVLKNADVICTSCTSSFMSNLISVFGNRKTGYSDKKMVCIIDDAISTREVDCVVTLLLGVTHLILVGDIYQSQPSCSSQATRSLRVDIPLFLRSYEYFKNNVEEKEQPIFYLRTQFRFTPSLSEFLNNHLYTNPFIVPEHRESVNLKSHLLLVDQIVLKDKFQKEKRENILMLKLVSELIKIQGSFRYAVITCSEEQNQFLQKKISKSDFPQVEVDRVQAFHGREFDVVFFLYDGSDIHLSMIATAFTRAKYSLFIVSLRHSLNENSWFRMLLSDAEKKNYVKFVHPNMQSNELESIFCSSFPTYNTT